MRRSEGLRLAKPIKIIMKKTMLKTVAALAVVSIGLFSGCREKSNQQPIGVDVLAADAFALGCVTAIYVSNISDKSIKGNELVRACATFNLTNSPALETSNIFLLAITRHSR